MKCRGFHNSIVSGLLVAAGLAMPARAETRTTSFATFMHIGPGRQYAVSDEVPTRTVLDVNGCTDGWCQIRYGGASGWIEQRMLATPAAAPKPAVECVDFARTGWPNSGDHERLCISPPNPATPPR